MVGVGAKIWTAEPATEEQYPLSTSRDVVGAPCVVVVLRRVDVVAHLAVTKRPVVVG